MSATGKGGLGVPTLLFHEGEGLMLAVETRDGTLYRGRCDLTEDNFNLSLYHATATARDGTERRLERAFIRGPQVVFVVYPDILAQAPYFERVRRAAAGKVVATGLGKARMAAIAAKAVKRSLEGDAMGGRGGGGAGAGGGRFSGGGGADVSGGWSGGRGGGRGFFGEGRGGGRAGVGSWGGGFPVAAAGWGSMGGGGGIGGGIGGGAGGAGAGRGLLATRPAWMTQPQQPQPQQPPQGR